MVHVSGERRSGEEHKHKGKGQEHKSGTVEDGDGAQDVEHKTSKLFCICIEFLRCTNVIFHFATPVQFQIRRDLDKG